MRQTISGLIAAIAVMSAAPAMACGGLFEGCSPCGQAYVSPCAQPQVYVAPVEPAYTGCAPCGGWAHEQLPEQVPYYSGRVHQYYYVNQGPTYTGAGDWAPAPSYREGAGYGERIHPHFRPWRHAGYRYHAHRAYHYGYGARMGGPRAYGYDEHMMHEHMRRYN